MAYENDDDAREFIGTDQKIKATPAKKAAPAAPVAAVADPGTPRAVYNPPKKGEAHPQIARKAAAERLDAAEANLNISQAELTSARGMLRTREAEEAASLEALLAELPQPTFDEVNRERLAKIQASKQERAEQGLPPIEKPMVSHGKSPIDTAAANRPRTSQALPTGAPLRSPVTRRLV